MNKFWIIVEHTFLTKVKAKSFRITTLVMAIFVLLFSNFDKITVLFSKDQANIGVIDQTGQLMNLVETTFEQSEKVVIIPFKGTEGEARKNLDSGDWKSYVVVNYDTEKLPVVTYKSLNITDNQVISELEKGFQQLKTNTVVQQLGLTQQQITKMYTPISFEKIALKEGAKSEDELENARQLVFIMIIVIYMAVISYGSMIAGEVATEKSSRIMEILISSSKPTDQMFGKIIGIALLSVVQFSILAGTAYASSIFRNQFEPTDVQGNSSFNLGAFFQVPASTLIYAIVFFLLGYFLYATIFAVLGSLVSRIEDIQQTIMPVTMIIVVVYMISIFGMSNPESLLMTICSFIPLFTPMIMFLRIGMLDIPTWEIMLGIGLLVTSIILVSWFGSKIYRGGVLMYKASTSYKDIRKALKMINK